MPLFSYTTQSKLSYTLCWSVPLIFPKLKLAHSFELIFKLTKAFQIISHKNYHFNLNDEFFISLTSKLMSSCTDCFTLGMKSQSLVCLLSASEYIYIYWNLGLEVEVLQRPSHKTHFHQLGVEYYERLVQSYLIAFNHT